MNQRSFGCWGGEPLQNETGVLLFAICVWLCAAIFIVIGIWALCRKIPMQFWSGSTVSATKIRDVRRYNRANGRMWILFGVGMAFIGFLSFWSVAAAAVFVFLYTLGGIPVLIVVYGKIYRKYQNL